MDIKQIEQIEASLLVALEQIQKIKAEFSMDRVTSHPRNMNLKLQRKSKYMAMLMLRKR